MSPFIRFGVSSHCLLLKIPQTIQTKKTIGYQTRV